MAGSQIGTSGEQNSWWQNTRSFCGKNGRLFMASKEPTVADGGRFDAARAKGQAHAGDSSAVVEARYDRSADSFRLLFRGGGTMSIPRRLIPGLEDQPASTLNAVTVSPAGDALLWKSIDADVYLPGLVEWAFGRRLFAAATGRQGGSRRSQVKTEAARRNGSKGGRPRKSDGSPQHT